MTNRETFKREARECITCKETKESVAFGTKCPNKCRACISKYSAEWTRKNRDKANTYQRELRARTKEYRRVKRRKHRQEALDKYGGKCACCGEETYEFLTFDHVNNDGAEHRKEVDPNMLLIWLKKNDYPDTIQVLCYNCNCTKGFYGACPHEKLPQFRGEGGEDKSHDCDLAIFCSDKKCRNCNPV